MAITYQSYEQTNKVLLDYAWSKTETKAYILLLNASYSFNKTHTTVEDVEAYSVGVPVEITGKTVSGGVLSCDNISFYSQGELTATFAVVYISPTGASLSSDPLLLHLRLNGGDTLTLSTNQSISLGNFYVFTTQNENICYLDTADYTDPINQDPVTNEPIIDPPAESPTIVNTIAELKTALSAATDGEVIHFTATNAEPFFLDGYVFTSQVKVVAINSCLVKGTVGVPSVNNGTGGAMCYIQNCSYLRLEGFTFTDSNVLYGLLVQDCNYVHLYNCVSHDNKTFGIYYRDCNGIFIDTCTVYNVGQEGIQLSPSVDQAFDDWHVKNCTVFNTGLSSPLGSSPYYGEGIYLGNGTYPNYGPITNVVVENCKVYNTRAEGIDCKSNVQNAIIRNNTIHNIFLPYNGAITVGSENELGFDSTYEIIGNTTYKISTTGGAFNPFAHIVVGRGNATIENNVMTGQGSNAYEFGISLFKTCLNQDFNDANIGRNTFSDFISANRTIINVYNANLGAVNEPMEYIVKPTSDFLPVLWLDASDTSTITATGSDVTGWADKSGLGFDAYQDAATKYPQTGTRTINSLNAIDFDGTNDFLRILNGPQCLDQSMIFAVFNADVVGSNRWILAFEESNNTKIGVGIDAGGYWFVHGAAGATFVQVSASTGVAMIAGYRTGTTQYIEAGGNTNTNANGEDQRGLDQWVIGCLAFTSSQSRFFNGAIGEIKVYDFYNSIIFDEQKTALAAKWGV